MRTVDVHEAATHLSELLASVEAGEEILIARDGRPVARLISVEASPGQRRRGLDEGRLHYSEDAHEPLPDDVTEELER